jgi:hippurate hydrolase
VLGVGHCIVALQSTVARNVDPLDSAVVSVTKVQAGDGWNQIPRTASMKGTALYLRQTTGDALEAAIRRVTDGVASTLDLTAQVSIWRGVPITENHPEAREIAAAAATSVAALRRDLPPTKGGEATGVANLSLCSRVPTRYLLESASPISRSRARGGHLDILSVGRIAGLSRIMSA